MQERILVLKIPDFCHLLVLVICALVFFIFGAYVAGGIIATSVILTDQPASWVGAIATVVAAIGTVSTLAFLIHQNRSQAKEIREERAKREAHEVKQQELLSFQKYEMHKTAFHSILDQLEKSISIKFRNRESLYESMFPHNNFNKCSIKFIDATFMNGILMRRAQICNHIALINSRNVQRDRDTDIIDYFAKVLDLSAHLQVSLQPIHSIGNIHWRLDNQPFLGNVFDLKSDLVALETVMSRLAKFCDHPFPAIQYEPIVGSYLIPFYKFLFTDNCKELYKLDFDKFLPLLSIFIRSYEELRKPGWINNCPALTKSNQSINNLIFDAPRLIELLKSENDIKELADELYTGYIQQLQNSTTKNPKFQQLAHDLYNISYPL